MKKIVLSLVVLVFALTAATFAVSAQAEINIGVSIWSSTDTLGSEVKRMIDAAAEALGDVNVTYVDQGHISEKVTDSVEQLALAGMDGIILCNSATAEMNAAINTADEYGVYLAQFFRTINPEANPNEYELARKSKYYVGTVHESEVDNGMRLVTILAEKGARKIGLMGWEAGDATFLGRWEGYQAGVEAWNAAHPDDPIELLEPQYGGTTSDTGRATAEAIINANPDIDALIAAGGGGDTLIGGLAAIDGLGLTGKIQVASTDFLPDLDEQLAKGAMSVESGGHYADPFFAFMMIYNTIKGKYETPEDSFHDMIFPYMYVASTEDYAKYAEYFTGDALPYNADEIRAMADYSYEELNEACESLSVEDVVSRHSN